MSENGNKSSSFMSKPSPERQSAILHNVKKPRKKRARNDKTDKRRRKEQGPRKNPNYFFAVQVSNPRIKGAMRAVQDYIVGQEELLKHIVVGVDTAHLTLGLLHLPDENSVQRAVSIFNDCGEKIREVALKDNFNMKVEGIGHFGKDVVFAKVSPDQNDECLRNISSLLRQEFEEFKSSSPFDYTPHITLMKMSKIRKNKQLQKMVRGIDKGYFQHFKSIYFGQQEIDCVQFLSMTKRHQEDGYYFCESEVSLDPDGCKVGGGSAVEDYAAFLSSYVIASAICMDSKAADGDSDFERGESIDGALKRTAEPYSTKLAENTVNTAKVAAAEQISNSTTKSSEN